jgi:hypothetical protein
MHRRPLLALVLLAPLFLGACAASPSLPTSGSRPVLVVAYTPNETVRRGFEQRLESDLQASDVRAIPSVGLIPEFTGITRESVIAAAVARDAPLILMVRRIITDLPGDGTAPPPGLRRHRSLAEYFANVDRNRAPDVPPPGRQVIEVAGYAHDGGRAELAWAGYSWVDFDGDLDAAIRQTADLIAARLLTDGGEHTGRR